MLFEIFFIIPFVLVSHFEFRFSILFSPVDTISRVVTVASMKLCFSTLVCPLWSLDQMIAAATSAGVGGIDFRGIREEIDITKLSDFNDRLDETLALLRASELALPCLNTSVTLVAPADRWAQMLDECQRY